MRALAFVLALLASVLTVPDGVLHAEEDRSGLVWMSGDEITATFKGEGLAGLYPSNRSWTETIRSDGTTDYREGGNHWQGTWWVRDREFCFSYPPPGMGGCFRVTRISANCYELYEFTQPTGSDETPPYIADLWNGRMWRTSSPTTCEARPSV